MLINTINCISYNTKERHRLEKAYEKIHNKFLAISDSFVNCSDDEEDIIWAKMKEAEELSYSAYMRCFAAQFPKCRNTWFEHVIKNYTLDEYHYITEKQYYAFLRYAHATDSNNWRDGKSYCRVDNLFVTLVWHNNLRAIKIISLN